MVIRKKYTELIRLYEKYEIFDNTYLEACYQEGIYWKQYLNYGVAINLFKKCGKYKDALTQKQICIKKKKDRWKW